jgi:hypothetical protein
MVARIIAIAGSFAIGVAGEPGLAAVAAGFIPTPEILRNPTCSTPPSASRRDGDAARLCPHRRSSRRENAATTSNRGEAIHFATIDSSFALMTALFITPPI